VIEQEEEEEEEEERRGEQRMFMGLFSLGDVTK
jgi:hypothetical protein